MTVSSVDDAVRTNSLFGQLPDEESIRLFKIEKTSCDPPLLCRLATFSLRDGNLPPYVALSYTWGPPVDDETAGRYEGSENQLLLPLASGDGSEGNIKVGRNLYEALEALVGEERHVWADAICINQLDLDEKAVQVQRMGSIFSGAQLVLAWPGKLDPDRTFEALEEISDALVAPIEAFDAFGRDGQRLLPMSATEARVYPFGEQDPVVTYRQMNSLDEFFRKRNLFKRAWIFQELVGHPVPVEIIISGRRLKLQPLVRVFSWLVMQTRRDEYESHRQRPIIRNSSGNLRVELMQIYKTQRSKDDAASLQRAEARFTMGFTGLSGPYSDFWGTVKLVLQYNSLSLATDPRDFIYSITHLINGGGTEQLRIVPDYRRDVSDLYREISSNMIQHIPLPAYFENLPTERMDKKAPTWTLDFRRFNRRVVLAEMHATNRAAARRRNRAALLDHILDEVCRFCLTAKCLEHFTTLGDKKFTKCLESTPFERRSLIHVSWPFVGLGGCRCDSVRDAQQIRLQDEVSGGTSPEKYFSVVRLMLQIYHEWLVRGQDASHALMHVMGRIVFSHNAEGPEFEALVSDFVRKHSVDINDLASIARYFHREGQSHWSEQLLDDYLHHLDALDGFKGWPRRCDVEGDKGEDEEHVLSLIDGTSASMRGDHSLNSEFAIFTTEAGLLGIDPNSLQKGDEVWLLNCIEERPAVLRRTSGGKSEFEVVGNVYIYEAMDGEYFERGLAGNAEKIRLV